MWSTLKNYTDAALLFLRVSLGCLFIYAYGWPELAGGLPKWKALGLTLQHVGVYFAPVFWGFLTACTYSLGSVFLILGFVFRPTCLVFILFCTVAAFTDYAGHSAHERFVNATHALEILLVFITLLFIGPGKFSIDKG